jgi:N-acetylmuramoyl-L-alanine amidase
MIGKWFDVVLTHLGKLGLPCLGRSIGKRVLSVELSFLPSQAHYHQAALRNCGFIRKLIVCAAIVGPIGSTFAQDQCIASQEGHYGSFGFPVTDRGPLNRGPLIFDTPQAAVAAAVAWVTLMDGPICGSPRPCRVGDVIARETTPTFSRTTYAMLTDVYGPFCSGPTVGVRNGSVQCTHSKPPKIITIDPGHGGTKCDDGMTGTTGPTYKDTEHDLALSIGLSLRDNLTSKGYKVVMTRTTAVCPTLQERVDIASKAKADLFVSIHFNGVDNPKTNGTEVYGLPKVPMSWQLATS